VIVAGAGHGPVAEEAADESRTDNDEARIAEALDDAGLG
jgi:hypothetical protein